MSKTRESIKELLIKMSAQERTEFFEREAAKAANASPDEKSITWVKFYVKTTKSGDEYEVPTSCLENTQALLSHYNITVKYNEMSKDVEIEVPGEEFHRDTALNTKLTWIRNKAAIKNYAKTEIDEHLGFIANKNAYHPVKDWILSKPWDKKSRLQPFYDSVKSDSDLKELYMKKWGVMAVAAVFNPEGIRPQGILTFEGSQGLGKTTWLSSIIGNPKWIGEGQALDPENKDSVLDVVSRWIVELGEIQATFTRSDIQSLKAFVTKNEDRIRAPYDKKANMYARRTVFFGTVDEKNFLNDKNGTRRFWTVSVQDININHGIDTQQLWAELYEIYKSGYAWWMDREEIYQVNASNDEYMVVDAIEELLGEHCRVASPDDKVTNFEWLNSTKILMRLGKSNPSKTDCNTVAKWLRKKNARYKRDYRQYLVDVDTINVEGKRNYTN
jgi:putative DNA primase/helicase